MDVGEKIQMVFFIGWLHHDKNVTMLEKREENIHEMLDD